MNLCLIFGYHGVIGASSFGTVCEYTRRVISAASDRALATGSLPLTDEEMTAQRELFFDISALMEKTKGTCAIHQLEAGVLNRQGFIREARSEFQSFVDFIKSEGESDLHNRYKSFQDDGFLNTLRELYDPECILCVMEKTPLRKNVLNLIHFLRTKFQDVKIGVVCNNWEYEGAYTANSMAARRTGMPVFIPGTCPQEYREQNDTFKTNRFTTNGLFDVVVQSHVEKMRKPSNALVSQAIEVLTEMTAIPEDTSRSRVYIFEGRGQNVRSAGKVKGVAKAYLAANGPVDIYRGVCDAMKDLAEYDSRWAAAYAQFTRVIGPLFQTHPAEGWRHAEMTNSDGNMLYLPPPIDPRLEKVEGVIVGPIHRAVLTDIRDRLPQCFPLSDGDISSACGGGIGGISGPVLFERYRTNVLPDAYRITLLTGSFIVRIEPKGGPKAAALTTLSHGSSISRLVQAGVAYSHGGIPLARTFRITKELAKATALPIAEGLAFIPSEVNSIGRDFTVQRYIDNRTVGSVRELVEGVVVRGYSQSRTKAQYSPSPSLFVDAALGVMTRLHAASIPSDLEGRSQLLVASSDHPLLFSVKECQGLLRGGGTDELGALGRALISYLQKERSTSQRACLIHGFLSLENYMFCQRSLEGHPDYPISVLAVANLGGSDVGDPLLDLAALTILTKAPLPEGIVGLPIGAKALFPKEGEIIDSYLSKAKDIGLDIGLNADDIKRLIFVYQAAHCYRRACILFSGLKVVKLHTQELERRMKQIERSSRLGLQILSDGIRVSNASKL